MVSSDTAPLMLECKCHNHGMHASKQAAATPSVAPDYVTSPGYMRPAPATTLSAPHGQPWPQRFPRCTAPCTRDHWCGMVCCRYCALCAGAGQGVPGWGPAQHHHHPALCRCLCRQVQAAHRQASMHGLDLAPPGSRISSTQLPAESGQARILPESATQSASGFWRHNG
jgi:hypothetical protein